MKRRPIAPGPPLLILGIETSCDETGVALYDSDARPAGRRAAFAGRPARASTAAWCRSSPRATTCAACCPSRAGARPAPAAASRTSTSIAYTQGPGLGGALLVGASVAAGLGLALGRPVVGIHHLEGHLLSPLLAEPRPAFPFVALLVSGGHTQLMRVEGVGRYTLAGRDASTTPPARPSTRPRRLLGLGYPGGPALARLAENGRRQALRVPAADDRERRPGFQLQRPEDRGAHARARASNAPTTRTRADLAASFQAAVVDVLVAKCLRPSSAKGCNRLVVAGGVGANARCASGSSAEARAIGRRSAISRRRRLCTDNGAMIAFAAALSIRRAERRRHALPGASRAGTSPGTRGLVRRRGDRPARPSATSSSARFTAVLEARPCARSTFSLGTIVGQMTIVSPSLPTAWRQFDRGGSREHPAGIPVQPPVFSEAGESGLPDVPLSRRCWTTSRSSSAWREASASAARASVELFARLVQARHPRLLALCAAR